jgi:3-phosphoshikimate 1-carboxyvinyltransferase
MQTTTSAPRPLETERSPWLRGSLRVPGDATLSALALAVAALARGETIIEDAFAGPEADTLAAALRELGVHLERVDGVWRVEGVGIKGFLAPLNDLDSGASPLVAALLMGLCGTSDFGARLVGDPQPVTHFDALLAGLLRFGTSVTAAEGGRLPVDLHGPRLAPPIEWRLPADLPAAKPGLLLAALHSPGTSKFIEDVTQPNHPERMLAAFGAKVTMTAGDEAGRTIELGGLPQLRGRTVHVPGDPSMAALAAMAATIVPNSDLRIENVLLNPARTMFLSALVAMGASVEAHGLTIRDGEEVADLAVKHQPLHGVALGAGHVALMLDEIPYLAVAAAFAEGDTVLNLPNALPIEASVRIAATARGLAANGVFCEASEETFIISGTGDVRGRGRVITGQDPAVGMAFLVLGMAAREQVTIDDQTGIEERFPGFVELFEKAGASFVRLT